MAASVYTTLISRHDEYGFQRPKGFDYISYDKFMTEYVAILVKRARRWETYLGKNPNYSKLKRSAKLERFVHKGIPMSLRGHIWMEITNARKKRDEVPSLYQDLLLKQVKSDTIIEQIDRDIPRTFPTNIFFRGKDPKSLEQPLFNVLLAFANHNSKIGYCQGLNYVVGMLLLVTKDEDQSFWILKCLLEDILPDYYSPNLPGLLVDMKVLNLLVEDHCPQLAKHLAAQNVTWELICSKWFICLFCDILPIETVLRIWDCILYNGSGIVMKVALLTVILHEEEMLKTKDFVELVTQFKIFTTSKKVLNCHEFIEKLLDKDFILPDDHLKSLREKCQVEVQEELDKRPK